MTNLRLSLRPPAVGQGHVTNLRLSLRPPAVGQGHAASNADRLLRAGLSHQQTLQRVVANDVVLAHTDVTLCWLAKRLKV